MIVRGTTPYHTFIVPLASQEIDEVYITYLQNGEVVLDKTKNDAEISDVVEAEDTLEEILEENSEENSEEEIIEEIELPSSQVVVHLSQEDTLKFKFFPAAEKNVAVVQLRILDTNGEAYASDPIHERIYGVLKEGVITSNETHTNN